jgi:hypothetical protein
MPTYGPKLQALIDGGCVDPQAVQSLSKKEQANFETLTQTEVDNLVSARQKVGKSLGIWWI